MTDQLTKHCEKNCLAVSTKVERLRHKSSCVQSLPHHCWRMQLLLSGYPLETKSLNTPAKLTTTLTWLPTCRKFAGGGMPDNPNWHKEVKVWEIHRCPQCMKPWASDASEEGASGRPILLACPPCANYDGHSDKRA